MLISIRFLRDYQSINERIATMKKQVKRKDIKCSGLGPRVYKLSDDDKKDLNSIAISIGKQIDKLVKKG